MADRCGERLGGKDRADAATQFAAALLVLQRDEGGTALFERRGAVDLGRAGRALAADDGLERAARQAQKRRLVFRSELGRELGSPMFLAFGRNEELQPQGRQPGGKNTRR